MYMWDWIKARQWMTWVKVCWKTVHSLSKLIPFKVGQTTLQISIVHLYQKFHAGRCWVYFCTGNKVNNIDVVYTPWYNLKKTPSMDVGQVGFHNPKLVRAHPLLFYSLFLQQDYTHMIFLCFDNNLKFMSSNSNYYIFEVHLW